MYNCIMYNYYSLVTLGTICVLCIGTLLILCVLDPRRGGEKNCLSALDFDGWSQTEGTCDCHGSHKQAQQCGRSPATIW